MTFQERNGKLQKKLQKSVIFIGKSCKYTAKAARLKILLLSFLTIKVVKNVLEAFEHYNDIAHIVDTIRILIN